MSSREHQALRGERLSGQSTTPLFWLLLVILLGVFAGAWFFRHAELFVTTIVLSTALLAGDSLLPWWKTRTRKRLLDGHSTTPVTTLAGILMLAFAALLVFPPALLIPLYLFLQTRGMPGGMRWEKEADAAKVRLGARKTLGLLPVYPTHAVPVGKSGVVGQAVPAGRSVGHLSSAWCEYTLVSRGGGTLLRIPSVEALRVAGPDGSVLVDVRGARIEEGLPDSMVPGAIHADLSRCTLRDLYRFAGYHVDEAEEGVEYYDEAAGDVIVYGERPARRPVITSNGISRQLPLDVPLHKLASGVWTVHHRHIAVGETVSVHGPVDVGDEGEKLFRSDARDVVLVKSGRHRCTETLPMGVFVVVLPVATAFLLYVVLSVVSFFRFYAAVFSGGGADDSTLAVSLWWWAFPSGLFLVLFGRYIMRVYNALVRCVNHVEYSWSLIEAALEKRAVLLEQLATVVEGALSHENSTLLQATRARWREAGGIPGQRHDVRSEILHRAVPEVTALFEAYPVLNGHQNVTQLFEAIVSVENSIQGTRQSYNEAVAHARTVLGMIPYVVFAPLFKKRRKSFWEL